MGTVIASAAGVAVLAYLGIEYTSVFKGSAVRINKLVLVIALTILMEGLIWMLASNLNISLRICVVLLLVSLFLVGFNPYNHELTREFWNRHYYGIHMLVGFIFAILLTYINW